MKNKVENYILFYFFVTFNSNLKIHQHEKNSFIYNHCPAGIIL
jgi:hypothetical protein